MFRDTLNRAASSRPDSPCSRRARRILSNSHSRDLCTSAVSLTWTVINRHSVTARRRKTARLLRKRHVLHHHTNRLPNSPENTWLPFPPEPWLYFTPIKTDTASSLSLDDHRSAFAAALAVLTAEFTAYLDRYTADPVADLVGYRQHAVWLSPGELHGMIDGLREAIAPHLANEPSPDRMQYLISPILFPVEAPPTENGTDNTATGSQSPGPCS
ncbi:hypothetical protein ACFW9I_22165 [[Kitasatospora] papulosa]|uniref:hypothetical protein n=1 Tax=[Kitasatospora] papulosa TaxID=1464011 RepID=UPI0036988AD3